MIGRYCLPLNSMIGYRDVPQNTPVAAQTSRLPFYKPTAPLSPLECAVPRRLTTVHSKELTKSAKPFRMRTYAKTGGRGPHLFAPSNRKFTREVTSGRVATLAKTAAVYLVSSQVE